jgi:pimeloyl-ACP methyl ester carboxylesterase
MSQNYEINGKNNSRSIIFIHGAGVSRKWWHPQVAALCDEFRVISLDLPGHGSLAGESFKIHMAVDNLNDLSEKEVGNTALLIGISLGGYLAMDYLQKFPKRVAGMILSGCSINMSGFSGLSFKLTGNMLKRKGKEWLKEVTIASYRKRVTQSVIEPVIDAGIFPDAAIEAFFELSGRNYYAMLKNCTVPILLINGEKDEPNRKAEKAFIKHAPQTQSSPIPGASHLANLEQPEVFNRLVRSFAETLNW